MTPTLDVRYPVGRFKFSDPYDPADRPLWLKQLADAPANLRAAVAGLSDQQLDTPYREGGWMLRQVVHHLADAHMNWYIRPKLAVTEDVPVTKTYAEELWSELADARTAPVEPSLKIMEGLTQRWLISFESLKESDWPRRFQNSEWGPLTVEDVLRSMAWHTRHHTAHITSMRQRMGW